MPEAEREVRMLSEVEEARLQEQIARDRDNPELTDEQLAEMRPFAEAFPEMAEKLRRARGLQKAPTKELISIRLDRDVVEHFRTTGTGWQSRLNAFLRGAVDGSTQSRR